MRGLVALTVMLCMALFCCNSADAQLFRRNVVRTSSTQVCVGPECAASQSYYQAVQRTPVVTRQVMTQRVAMPVVAPPLPVVVSAPVPMGFAATANPEMSAFADTNFAFRRTLLKAARQARAEGQIDSGQYMALYAASLNPRILNGMRDSAQDTLQQEGNPMVGAFDWEQFFAAIIRMLPDLLKILDLF